MPRSLPRTLHAPSGDQSSWPADSVILVRLSAQLWQEDSDTQVNCLGYPKKSLLLNYEPLDGVHSHLASKHPDTRTHDLKHVMFITDKIHFDKQSSKAQDS